MKQTLVITGASGSIATAIRPLLAVAGRVVRLVDMTPPEDIREHESFVQASITDASAMEAALSGADALIHLAGHRSERPWNEILETNINGSCVVLEAAKRTRVARVLMASSIHAVGYATVAETRRVEVLPPRPDTYYGVGKVATEALASLYADRFGMSIVSARICAFLNEPGMGRSAAAWCSPGDMTRLVEATVALSEPGHHIVWGVSSNFPDWFPLDVGQRMGFNPVDDSAEWADAHPGARASIPSDKSRLAGVFIDDEHPLGERWSR